MMILLWLYLMVGVFAAIIAFVFLPIMLGGNVKAWGKWTVPLALITVVAWPPSWIALLTLGYLSDE